VIINHGALQPLLKAVDTPNVKFEIIKPGTWAISNSCRGRPLPSLERVRSAIPTLCNVVCSQTDQDILIDAVWALSYLSRSGETIKDVMNCPKVIPILASLLS